MTSKTTSHRSGSLKRTVQTRRAQPIQQRVPINGLAPNPAEMQQRLGNRGTQAWVAGQGAVQPVQAKFTVGEPDDIYEQEADRVAETVMRMSEPAMPEEEEAEVQAKPIANQITPLVRRMPEEGDEEEIGQAKPVIQRQSEEEEEETVQAKQFPSNLPSQVSSTGPGANNSHNPSIQRLCTECKEVMQRQPDDEEELAQTKSLGYQQFVAREPSVQPKDVRGQTPQVSPATAANIDSLKGGGRSLPRSTRSFFEPRFGANFSQVRVHTDTRAAETAKSINARAFTVGRDIAFGASQYAPESHGGRQLLAHELTHVVQQNSGQLQREPLLGKEQTRQVNSSLASDLEPGKGLGAPWVKPGGSTRRGLVRREVISRRPDSRGNSRKVPLNFLTLRSLETAIVQRDQDDDDRRDWVPASDHLLMLGAGDRWVLMPGADILLRPSRSALQAARTTPGRMPDAGTLLEVPATGASGTRLVRSGVRQVLVLDAGRGSRVTAAIYMDQVQTLMARMGVTEVAQLRIIHVHRDHVSEIPTMVSTMGLRPGQLVIPEEFVRGGARRDLQRAINALRANGGPAWSGWLPGTLGRDRASAPGYTQIRYTHGEITIEQVALRSAMRRLASGGGTAADVDRASFLTRVTRRSDGARIMVLGDLRMSDLGLFRTAMGSARFNQFFEGVTTISGFSHHAGRFEARDVSGLMALLDATLYRTGRLRVVVQTDRTVHAQARQNTIEFMRRIGIEVVIAERAQAVGEGGSSASASREALSAQGQRASRLTPIASPLTAAAQRIQQLREARVTIQNWRMLFQSRGANVNDMITEIDRAIESLTRSTRAATEAASQVRASGSTTAGGGRDYTGGTRGAAYQNALAAIPATTNAETAIGRRGFNALRELRERSTEEIPRQVALERALREGRYSRQAFQYMLSQMDSTTRRSILYGRRGGDRPRDVQFRRLRAEFLFRASVMPSGNVMSLAGISRGRARVFRGAGALAAIAELIRIGSEVHHTIRVSRSLSRQRKVHPFLRRLMFWNQLAVRPRLEAVDEGVFSNDHETDYDAVVRGLREDQWDALFIPHSDARPAIPDAEVLRFGYMMSQHVRNYDEFATLFIDSDQDAVRSRGEGSWSDKHWEVKVGRYETSGENHVVESWVEIPRLTEMMRRYTRTLIANTEELLRQRARGEAPSELSPDPRRGGLSRAGVAVRYRARLASPAEQSTVYVKTMGRNQRQLARQVRWWSAPRFLVHSVRGGQARVSGADYNTFAVLRRLRTERVQLNIGQSGTWESTNILGNEGGIVYIDSNLITRDPELTRARGERTVGQQGVQVFGRFQTFEHLRAGEGKLSYEGFLSRNQRVSGFIANRAANGLLVGGPVRFIPLRQLTQSRWHVRIEPNWQSFDQNGRALEYVTSPIVNSIEILSWDMNP